MRKRAVLACALVVGPGAAMTLASWTDNENATGTFTASVFSTESNPASTAWASNSSAPGATLPFSATAMSPGSEVYTNLDVRTTATTSVAGTVTLSAVATTGTLTASLVYKVVRTTTATTCTAAMFTNAGSTFIAGSSSTYIAANTVPTGGGQVASAIAAAGGSLRYCFDVQLPVAASNSLQGATGASTWTFSAVSN